MGAVHFRPPLVPWLGSVYTSTAAQVLATFCCRCSFGLSSPSPLSIFPSFSYSVPPQARYVASSPIASEPRRGSLSDAPIRRLFAADVQCHELHRVLARRVWCTRWSVDRPARYMASPLAFFSSLEFLSYYCFFFIRSCSMSGYAAQRSNWRPLVPVVEEHLICIFFSILLFASTGRTLLGDRDKGLRH